MEPVQDRLVLEDEEARFLAKEFGHPLYVLDEAIFRNGIRRYKAAFEAAWPNCELTYASKANSTLALLAIAAQEGCRIDCASEGELRAALAAGVPADRIHLHGNCKRESELDFALSCGVSQIVVDNREELEYLGSVKASLPELLLRIAPAVDPETNIKISTGQSDTKFGFCMADGAAEAAVDYCLERNLPLVGLHCHVGSQLMNPEAQINGGRILARFAARMLKEKGWKAKVLNPGGGMGVSYRPQDHPMLVEDYCQILAAGILQELEGTGLEPQLVQEPGRSLVAPAGLTLYQVGAVKRVVFEGGSRTYACVHGGLADNPRPALYGASHPVTHVAQLPRESADAAIFTVSGRHCETDLLFADVSLPGDLKKGDFLQVLLTGAYNACMASQYNRYPRPRAVMKRLSGAWEIVQESDSWEDIFARENLPSDLQTQPCTD